MRSRLKSRRPCFSRILTFCGNEEQPIAKCGGRRRIRRYIVHLVGFVDFIPFSQAWSLVDLLACPTLFCAMPAGTGLFWMRCSDPHDVNPTE